MLARPLALKVTVGGFRSGGLEVNPYG
jgi:hypothetical protein